MSDLDTFDSSVYKSWLFFDCLADVANGVAVPIDEDGSPRDRVQQTRLQGRHDLHNFP